MSSAKETIVCLLNQYERFLETTNASEDKLVQEFMDKDKRHKHVKAANEFGDSMFKALTIIGNGSPFHRLLIV